MLIDVPTQGSSLPRERALSEGVFSLGDAELLALVIGTGRRGQSVVELATAVLERFDGLDGLARTGAHALADQSGIGTVKALRILAGMELGRRFVYRAGRRREPVVSSIGIFERFGPLLGGLDYEEMWVVSIDARNAIRGSRRVALGGVHACAMRARDILRAGLLDGASGLVVVHNHPSGTASPSMEDIVMTKRLLAAADVVGVTLIDHVIIGTAEDYCSLLDLGLIPERASAPSDLANRPYRARATHVPEAP